MTQITNLSQYADGIANLCYSTFTDSAMPQPPGGLHRPPRIGDLSGPQQAVRSADLLLLQPGPSWITLHYPASQPVPGIDNWF